MSQRITIKEIARRADVSIGTVDRVLHNRGRVAEKTKERILQIAEEGNYSSNVYARNLRLNKVYQFAVVLPTLNSYWEMIKEGIEGGVKEHDSVPIRLNYYTFDHGAPLEMETALLEALLTAPDGVIIAPTEFKLPLSIAQKLRKSEVPYVFVDSSGKEAHSISSIGQDAFQGGRLAASLLFSRSNPKAKYYMVTFSSKELLEQTISERMNGFSHFLQEHEVGKQNALTVNMEKDGLDQDAFYELLKQDEGPVNLFVPNSKAHNLSAILEDKQGWKRLRVVGFDMHGKNVALLEKGHIDFIIHQKPQMQGFLSVQTLYRHLVLGNEVPKNQFIPLDIITKENLMYCES